MKNRFLGTCVFVLLGYVPLKGQVPAEYYDGAAGVSGAPLKSALNQII